MTTQTEKHEFRTEVQELLQLVIHSLYSHKEIFLRELVSNSSDALDKLRFAALTNPALLPDGERLRIRIELDPAERILRVIDNGIGMTRDEVVDNIGTIARSGTRRFLQEIKSGEKKAGDLPRLIGQFGVGFYSSFMVADRVVLETRSASGGKGVRWTSTGDGSYEVEELERAKRGTSVALHLKPVDPDDESEFKDFLQPWVIRCVVKKYSDFVEYPIEMDEEREKDGEKTVETVVLNSMKPLWTRPRGEVEPEEYAEFYKHLSHDWEDPLETIHFVAEGTNQYTALLFLPKRKPFDLFDPSAGKSKVALYVKRVQIAGECEELMPVWLRFVRGLVDSDDLPLNISRETLQHNRQVRQIQKRLVRKVLDTLEKCLANDREKYLGFWKSFGSVVKEGIYYDDGFKDEVAALALFQSSAGEDLVTLGEYVERMPAKQKAIYYLTGADRRTLEGSPHLELVRSRGFEVLFLTDNVDEFVTQRLHEFQGKELLALDRGAVDLETDEEKSAREAKEKELSKVLEAVRKELDEHVKEVRFSSRLRESPAVLVTDEHGLSPHLERIMREARQEVEPQKRILELNADHPVVQRLAALEGGSKGAAAFADTCELLYGQALLAEGSALPDPARFSKLLSELMVKAGG